MTSRTSTSTAAPRTSTWRAAGSAVRIEAQSRTPDSIFVGIAPTSDVDAYLQGVAHTIVSDPSGDNGRPETTYVDGDTTTIQPDEVFWAASAAARPQALTWDPEDGDWTIVVANADDISRWRRLFPVLTSWRSGCRGPAPGCSCSWPRRWLATLDDVRRSEPRRS